MTIATFSDRTATFPQTTATNAAGTAIIEAQNVGKTYRAERGKELTVLRDISFTLHEGEIVAILGRSGAGKSTHPGGPGTRVERYRHLPRHRHHRP